MKPQPTPTSSVTRSLTAMALMAASSLSFSHAEDISGSAYGPTFEMPLGGLSTPIPAGEHQRGGIAQVHITSSGAFSLSVAFTHHVHRQTGVFVLDETSGSPPEYVANLGVTSGGYLLSAVLHSERAVFLRWQTADGTFVGLDTLGPRVSRDDDPYLRPGAYSTVHIKADGFYSPDPSFPQVNTGAGYGALLMSASGASVFAGTLPDGQTVTGGGQLTNGAGIDFQVPVLLRTISGRDTVLGHMPGIDQGQSLPVYGQMRWVKGAASHDALCPPGGVSNAWATTSAYTPPAAGERMLLGVADAPLNALLALYSNDRTYTGGFGFLEKAFTVTANHRAVFPTPNPEKVEVKFLPALGLFTGKVKLPFTPPMQPRTVHFSGMVKQHRYIEPTTGEPAWTTGDAEGFYLADPLPGTFDVPKISGGVMLLPYPY